MTVYLSFALAAVLVLCGAGLLALALRVRARTGHLPRLEAVLATALLVVGALLVYRLQAPRIPELEPAETAERPPMPPGSPVLSVQPNVPAPELRYTLLDGTTERLSALKGKVVIVNFWATWCGPCLTELPALSSLQDRLAPLGLVVVTISSEPPDTVRAFVQKTPLRTVVATASPEALTGVFEGGLDNLPTSFVIDREGTVVAREIGGRTHEQFEELVAGPLAPNLAMR